MKNLILLSFLFSIVFCSCISNKKHLEAMQGLKMEKENFYTQEANKWARDLNQSQDSVTSLRLQLAERKGENNILTNLRLELLAQIANLEGRIENVSSSSQSTQQNLSSTVAQKEKEIADLKLKLKNVEEVLSRYLDQFNQMAGDINYAFQELNFQDFELITTNEKLRLIFPEKVLFRKGRTDRIEKGGVAVMEKLSAVLVKYPIMEILVVGHTDNSPSGRKSLPDNWKLSAYQATMIVDLLSDEFDVNTSQLTAAGKGEYEPRASNETAEGKEQNRRIEFVFTQRGEGLEKAIRKELK